MSTAGGCATARDCTIGPPGDCTRATEEARVRLPSERFDYSPITARRPWRLPKGARIAVWTIVNVEGWDIEKPTARQYLTAPQGVTTVPDIPNWAWHGYGMRVGFWRMLEALGKRKIRATTSIHANVVRARSEEHTSELQSQSNLVCRLLLEKKKIHSVDTRINLCTRPRHTHAPSLSICWAPYTRMSVIISSSNSYHTRNRRTQHAHAHSLTA